MMKWLESGMDHWFTYSEFEAKQPQLQPKPVGSDPQALYNPRPQPESKTSLILLDNNPFTSVIYGGTTYVNVFSEDHQRTAGSVVRFRGAPVVNRCWTWWCIFRFPLIVKIYNNLQPYLHLIM